MRYVLNFIKQFKLYNNIKKRFFDFIYVILTELNLYKNIPLLSVGIQYFPLYNLTNISHSDIFIHNIF